MLRVLTVAIIAAFAVGVARAGPERTAADLVTVAPRLVPKGSAVIAAQQMNATFGIVAYRTPVSTGAFAVRWRGRWIREHSPDLRFADLEPNRGQIVTDDPVLISVQTLSADVIIRSGLWVNGRHVIPPVSTGDETGVVAQYLMKARPGRNTVAVFSATKTGAKATAWSFASR